MTTNTIHVAMACDDNYAHHLAITICSILVNMSQERNLCIYILHENLTGKTKAKLEQLKNVRQFELRYINVSCDKYESFKVIVASYISKLTYARFQLPEILSHLNKCLYLDCDILVRLDLGELWDIELPDQAFLGAVEEPAARHRNKDLKLPDSYSYFNAGVLMLNLEKLRLFHLEEKAFGYLQDKGSLLYGDQDVMNALFCHTWYALPLKWNVHSHVYMLKNVNKYYRYTKQESDTVFDHVAIVHFSHKTKPDSLMSQSPYRDEYWQYKRFTAWKHSLPKDINPVNMTIWLYWTAKKFLHKIPVLFLGLRTIKRFLTGYYFSKKQSSI